METFKWKEAFNLGLDRIDHQHRELLDLLNRCLDESARQPQAGLDRQLVAELEGYVTRHFRLEEEWMEAAGYDDLERHRAQHQLFTARIGELSEANDGAAPTRVSSLAAFLRDWFIHHILGDDRRYAPVVVRWEAERLKFL